MQIGPYQLTRCLGQGGMGEVWLGKRTAMGSAAKVVAVKLLRTPDAAARDNFVKEAKLAMLLRHSTIVQVHDVGESQGTCFMEMEWVDGLDLSRLNQYLRETDQQLPVGVAAYVIGELLKALTFAHALDVDGRRETIVHRDVTPHNVLISRSGEVKLTDFGIAFMTSDKTSSELIKGKSRYMSPEHVRQVREPCIDIFGVGAIFHEMLDGRKFRHTAQSDVDLWSMAFAGDVPALSIELPAELEELRRGLLARDLDERFASVRAALAALRRWPGYRDASEELEALVRETPVDDAPLTATEHLPGVQLDRNESTAPEQGSPAQSDGSETEAIPAPNWSTKSTTEPSSRSHNRVLPVMLALIGLGFGVWGVSMLINQTPEAEPNEAPETGRTLTEPSKLVTVEPSPDESTPIAPLPPVEPTPAKLPQPVELPPVTPTPVEAPHVEDTKSNSEPKLPAKAKTEVTLAASGYPWVKIRIGSATHILDRKSSPSKKISLRPGSHTIAFQIDEEEPWQELGKVTIPAQPKARLELQKPGKVVVE